MITKKEVQHTAKLARLELNEKEVEKMQKELSLILEYFEKLKEVDVSETNPISHVPEIKIKGKKELREDKIQKRNIKDIQEILKQLPAKKEKYAKVKSVL